MYAIVGKEYKTPELHGECAIHQIRGSHTVLVNGVFGTVMEQTDITDIDKIELAHV